MEIFLHAETWIALLTLTFLEIVLGVDNIIFISVLTNKLPEAIQQKARMVGLSMALIVRILLLLGISWLIHFTKPLFTVGDMGISGRDLILGLGGLFLLAKSTSEIYHKMEEHDIDENFKVRTSFISIIIQIILLDIIFSFDSILTAVGLAKEVIVMILAIIIAMIIMMIFAKRIGDFIKKYPSMEILALSFLILIGFMLVMEGLHKEIPKGYIYFAIFFSVVVEAINIRLRKKHPSHKLAKTKETVPAEVVKTPETPKTDK